MKILPKILGVVVGAVVSLVAAAWPAPAHATDLVVVKQSMLQFACMFDADCSNSIAPADVGALPPSRPGSDPRLHSISFAAKSSSPAAGTTVYVYRVDLTKADEFTECMAGLVVNFGPPARMPAAISNAAHMFVITGGTGGTGTVAVKSADHDGDFITFNFDGPLCPGQSSLLFGLASTNPPVLNEAMLLGYGAPPIIPLPAQTPRH